jgi:hypothetical protein
VLIASPRADDLDLLGARRVRLGTGLVIDAFPHGVAALIDGARDGVV